MHTSLFADTPFFRRFFDDSPVSMAVVTIDDGRYADVNPAFARLMGYPREALAGRPFRDTALDGGSSQTVLSSPPAALAGAGDVTLFLETRDGRALTCVASIQIEQIGGRPYYFLIMQDVTGQEPALAELRLSEDRFQLFFRSIPLALLVIDDDYHIADANRAACELYGCTVETFGRLSLRDLTPPDDWPALRDALAGDGRGERAVISRQRLRDGRAIDVEISRDRVTWGARRYTLAVVRDVTEERAIEAELIAGQERLRIVADMTTDTTVWLRDLATNQVVWNSSLTARFGYDESARPTHQWWVAHVHPDDRAAIEASIEAALASTGDQWENEYRFLRADGTYANVLDRGRIIRDEHGRPVRFLGAMVDITGQLQAAEAARRAALEERQRLARELNESVTQLLIRLSLMAETTRRQLDGDAGPLSVEAIGRMGELARQALRQLRLLVYELRPSQLEQVGLAAALRHRLEAVEQRAGVAFRLQDALTAPVPAGLKSEVYRLAQDILNFSLKHIGSATVTVRLRNDPSTLTLEISDDGRITDAAASEGELAVMHKRVAAMGGALTVEDDGRGSTTLRADIPMTLP